MGTVGAYEAKTHLPKLLERVSKGEKIVITKHGTPVAVLQPPEIFMGVNVQDVIEEIKQFRSGNKLNGLELKRLIEDGRK